MTVAEVLAALGRAAPFDKAAGWDPVGLQVGDIEAVVERAAVCHDVTDAVVAALESDPPDLLVPYHPLLFRPVTRFLAGPSPSGRALRLAALGVAVGVVHTAFDVARGGTADALAEELGLRDVSGFGPLWGEDSVKLVTFVPAVAVDAVASALTGAGAGTIGNYSACSFRTAGIGTFHAGAGTRPAAGRPAAWNSEEEIRLEMSAPRSRLDAVASALVAAHPYEEPAFDVYERRGDAAMVGRVGSVDAASTAADLAATAKERLRGDVRMAGGRDTPIRRVAVVPGSGADFIEAAADAGANALVTGDVSHHRAREALDRGLAVIDAGHAGSERPGVRRLYAAVAEIVDTVDLSEVDPDPWS